MMRSMYSAISGLGVHQTKMDVIGNNIANVNTTGFKAQRVTFSDVFSETLQSGTAANDLTGKGGMNAMQIGLGVGVSSIDVLMTQGAAQRTDNPFDLMISGDGFLVVGDNTGSYFTRAGALRQDAAGNLVTPNGMKVMGWPAVESEDGGTEIQQGEVGPIQLGSPENSFSAPETTTKTTISGNLNKDDGEITTQIKMYDSLGNLYSTNVKMTYHPQETDADGNVVEAHWTVEPASTKDMTVTDEDGNTVEKNMMILKSTTGEEFAVENVFNLGDPDGTGEETAQPFKIAFGVDGSFDTGGSDGLGITLDQIDMTTAIDPETGESKGFTAEIGNDEGLTVDISKLTQFASNSDIDAKVVDGTAPGAMTGFNIGTDGKITAYYNNGAMKLLGQVVVAEFDNPTGLEKVGDSLFRTTANSGDFDNIGKVGAFQTGVLEMSNVDLSSEFTDMITTQRGYQANSRVITVSDELLQELVNLK